MEFKDTNNYLDITEINELTRLLMSNLENNNIKYSEITVSNTKKNVNSTKNNFTFNCEGLFNGTISLTLKNQKQLNKISKIKSDLKLLANRFVSNYRYSENSESVQDLIGVSQHIIDIENFIREVSLNKHSVLIEGEYGCEQLTIATCIHFNNFFEKNEMYELNCCKLAVYKDSLNYINNLKKIKHGTLYISNIDVLNRQQQDKVLITLETLANGVRILTSSTKCLEEQIKKGLFSQSLYGYINTLKITLPKLKDRQEDIPHILNSISKKNKQGKKFSNESIELFKNYAWPNNLIELKNTAIKLLRQSKNSTISLSDIEKHAPQMLSGKKSVIDHALLIESLTEKNFSCFESFHPSLKKSLFFIANNHEQEISLDTLSEKSHISPSHLSYLFRSNFGISFKIIISKFRVEMIKRYFIEHPNKSITESALDNGFGDLSHFEKIFKKYTNMTPKKYKSLKNKIS